MTTPDHSHDQDVTELREATERLTEQVGVLSLALQTVNHLQRRQLETDRRVNKVEEDSVTREDFGRSVKDVVDRTTVARLMAQRRLRIWAISAATIALVLALLADGFAFKVNRDRINEQQHQRIELCMSNNQVRQEQAAQTREYFGPKLRAELANPQADPVLVSILRALANSQPDLVACPTR